MKATKTGTTQTKTTQTRPAAGPCSCGCQGGSSGGACTCCKPICFERPNYFCGQLLSDDDLSAEQRYFREKRKLYHRTLTGHGVVCGLRLTCDPDCCGRIRIGEGYAIDNCGNDLVVCQSTPFDVIAALKAKGYLITEPPPDPCEEEEPPRCKVKQCFYITICYDEEEAEYTTPFKTNCGPGAAACEPTRIRETVRFDVLENPPKAHTYLDELEERITCCWKVFTDSPFARKFTEFLADREKGEGEEDEDTANLLPVESPVPASSEEVPGPVRLHALGTGLPSPVPDEDRRRYEGCQESFYKLYELIVRYAYDCMLGEMIFECPCPPKAHCVGLGTVEVEDGKVLRCATARGPTSGRSPISSRCSWRRSWVGPPCAAPPRGRIREKAHSEIGRRGAQHQQCEDNERHCCATFDIDCEQFLTLFQTGRTSARLRPRRQSMRSPFDGIGENRVQLHRPSGLLPRDLPGDAGRQGPGSGQTLAGERRAARCWKSPTRRITRRPTRSRHSSAACSSGRATRWSRPPRAMAILQDRRAAAGSGPDRAIAGVERSREGRRKQGRPGPGIGRVHEQGARRPARPNRCDPRGAQVGPRGHDAAS